MKNTSATLHGVMSLLGSLWAEGRYGAGVTAAGLGVHGLGVSTHRSPGKAKIPLFVAKK